VAIDVILTAAGSRAAYIQPEALLEFLGVQRARQASRLAPVAHQPRRVAVVGIEKANFCCPQAVAAQPNLLERPVIELVERGRQHLNKDAIRPDAGSEQSRETYQFQE
jgi:hypothetical protein